jgi:hypothetical protein
VNTIANAMIRATIFRPSSLCVQDCFAVLIVRSISSSLSLRQKTGALLLWIAGSFSSIEMTFGKSPDLMFHPLRTFPSPQGQWLLRVVHIYS